MQTLARKAERALPALSLLLWGGMLVGFHASGRLNHLLHPSFHGLVLVTGILLLGSAACVLLSPGEVAEKEEHGGCGCGCGPGRRLGRWFAAFILLVPLPLAAWISPDQYGPTLVQNRLGTVADVATFPPAAAPGKPAPEGVKPRRVEIGDLLIAALTPEGRAAYEGKPVELIGQVIPIGKEQTEFVRLLMLCCAADAQVLSVRVNGPCDVPAMQWGRAHGTVHFIAQGERQNPVVAARIITPVPPPADPYVYHGGTAPPPRHISPIGPGSPGNFNLQLPPR